MNNKGIWVSLGLGLAVGGLLGVLFAPEKGSTTRNKIRQSGRRASDSLQHGMTRIKGDLKQFRDELEESIESRDGSHRKNIS
jgi:gas vesicle protein